MKHLKRILWVVAVLAMITALSATALADGPSLAFTKDSFEVYAGNGIYLASAENLKQEGDPGELTWIGSNDSIARMYSWGYLSAIKPGEVTVSVTGKNGGSASTKVIVKDNPATITLTPAALTLEAGKSDTLEYFLTFEKDDQPQMVDPGDIVWTSSDEDIVKITNIDYDEVDISAQNKEGTATITGTLQNEGGTVATASATITVTKAKPTSIKFARDQYKTKYGQSKRMKLTVKPVQVRFTNEEDITFESSDEQIATVSSYFYNGVAYCDVYPQKPGTVTITATYEPDPTITATTTVVIEAKPISKVSLNRDKLTLADNRITYDKSIWFKVEPSSAYFDRKETYWESSDTDIIRVDEYGLYSQEGYVTLYIGEKYGTATITAHVTDGTNWFTASCEVTVISQDTGISLDITKKTIYLYAQDNQSDYKDYFYLTAFNGAGDKFDASKVKWSSSKKKVATVNKSGKVKAVKAGKSTITATGPDGSTATCKVTVKKNLIKKITGNKLITMRIGDTDYADNYLVFSPKWYTLYDPTLSYTSSDDSVVSVSPDGKLKANGIGTAKITVKAQDGSKKKFTFKVKVIEERE
jgi:uncharacterized protein YjdB